MNWKLVRFVALWTVGVWLALLQYHPPTPPAHRPTPTEKWIAAHPRRTAGCPALHPQLAAWQQSLVLTDWKIDLVCDGHPYREDLLGWTRPDPKTRTAKIGVRDGLSRGWQQAVVVHELLHVGAADGRWPAPRGHDPEEEYVDEMSFRVLADRASEVRQQMLERARSTASVVGPAGQWTDSLASSRGGTASAGRASAYPAQPAARAGAGR